MPTATERCFGTRDVLRHARDVPRHARDVPRHARDVLRHARDVLRHAKRCSGTATGDVQPKVLRHARCSGTRCASAQETQGHATATTTTGRDHGRLRTTAGTRECDTRLRFSSGRLPVSSTPLVHMALRTRPQRGEAIVRIWHGSVGDRIHVGDETARRGLALGYEDHGSPGFGGSNDSSLRILSVCSYCPRRPTLARHVVSLPRERDPEV